MIELVPACTCADRLKNPLSSLSSCCMWSFLAFPISKTYFLQKPIRGIVAGEALSACCTSYQMICGVICAGEGGEAPGSDTISSLFLSMCKNMCRESQTISIITWEIYKINRLLQYMFSLVASRLKRKCQLSSSSGFVMEVWSRARTWTWHNDTRKRPLNTHKIL